MGAVGEGGGDMGSSFVNLLNTPLGHTIQDTHNRWRVR